MNTKVSGRESVNVAAEPGCDFLEIDVFDGTESVRAKNRCNASRFETAESAEFGLGRRSLLDPRNMFGHALSVAQADARSMRETIGR
jgi:hypothetical protein